NNCFENGLLPVVLPGEIIEGLARQVQANPATNRILVDLTTLQIQGPDGTLTSFQVSALKREALLEGLDAIALTRKREAQIADFQERDKQQRPWIYNPGQ